MAIIRTEQLRDGAATGMRHSGCDHEVTIWSYDTYATIYYASGEPVACIRRPSRGDDKWRVYAPNGEEIGKGYPMQRMAFRAFLIWQGVL